jgi:DnaJ like chaperone protein
LVGLAIGHVFDQKMGRGGNFKEAMNERERIQTLFFLTTFSTMGAIAKADGRVSEEEIAMAEAAMAQFGLDEDQRALAVKMFNEGKSAGFQLWTLIDQFKAECPRQKSLYRIFMSIQIQLALCDGHLHARELDMLRQLASRLGLALGEFEAMLTREKQSYEHTSRQYQRSGQSSSRQRGSGQEPGELRAAYQILGVSPHDTDEAVKKAYRRMMNQYHPDKLVARGMPEEMQAAATEKVKEIQRAWKLVKEARG